MKFHAGAMLEIRDGHPGGRAPPEIFVETGTWKGRATELAKNYFRDVHTIELSVVHHLRAWRKFWHYSHVHCHFGDTRTVLKVLCDEVLPPGVPVYYYLDAHWFDVPHVEGRGRFPLWAEIEAIAARAAQDIVVVDDVYSFGATHPEPAWLDVTLANIVAAFERAGRTCPASWEREGCDQVAVYLA